MGSPLLAVPRPALTSCPPPCCSRGSHWEGGQDRRGLEGNRGTSAASDSQTYNLTALRRSHLPNDPSLLVLQEGQNEEHFHLEHQESPGTGEGRRQLQRTGALPALRAPPSARPAPLSLTTRHPTPQQGWTRADPVPAITRGLTRPASPCCQWKAQLLAWPCSPAHAQDRSLNSSRAPCLPSSSALRPRKFLPGFPVLPPASQSSKWVSTRLIGPDVPAHMQMSSNTKHTEDNLYSCSSAPC